MSGELPIHSDETLLGYILGGLSDQENAQIEEALSHSQSLRLRLRDLRSMLEPLAHEPIGQPTEDDPQWNPPDGLVESTMAAIAANGSATHEQSQVPAPAFPFLASEAPAAQNSSNRVAWLDSLVTLAAGVVILSLILPGILKWRESARRQECAENLRNIGSALSTFAHFQPTHRLPPLELHGPLAFAGIYSIRLQDNHLLESKRWLQCPNDASDSLLANIPTSKQFLQAPESTRYVWRMLAGGDYSYNMGSIVDGKYCAPSIESPTRVAWIGDTLPVEQAKFIQDGDFEYHGPRGLNILYSDGSVQWLKLPKLNQMASIDHPYLNQDRKQAPGIGEADACLGPSHLLAIPQASSD